MTEFEIKHFHLFCGLGGGARGFNRGQARVGTLNAKFRCIGGIDNDAAAIRDFNKLAGVSGTLLDLFSRQQYVDFHGHEPPDGWREATPTDIHAAAGGERPQIIFLSAPCKGFSGLLSETRSKTDKYQALNALTLRGMWLALEAWKDDPVELFVFENVPRIANRGRHLLDQIVGMLRHYGYAVAETTHDCSELGGLAQSRRRFLLVARHIQKVPPFLYEPEKKRLRAVGDVLDKIPIPLSGIGGPMHRIPSLQWKTWVRLAFVEAGSDWRSLNRLKVEDGKLRDYLIVPEGRNNGFMGANRWDAPAGTVAGASRPGNGNFSVADPRYEGQDYGSYGVLDWQDSAGTVTGARSPGQGRFSVADPRTAESGRSGPLGVCFWGATAKTVAGESFPTNGNFSVADPRMNGNTAENRHKNVFRIVDWDEAAGTISGGHGPSSGGQCVADPRYAPGAMGTHANKMKVIDWDRSMPTVTGSDRVGSGALSVADPRILNRSKGDNYLTGGHYGVVPWDSHALAVSGSACHDNGWNSVADPRLPEASEQLIAVIRALDGTWHRPFTTLELAALQSLVDPEEFLELDGLSDSAWRERVGNAVPSDAAAAVAGVMGVTLMLAATGQTFMLSNMPIWVRPVAVGLAVQGPQP